MMIIIETCPRCGHDLSDTVICSNPPIPKKECIYCGWAWEGEPDQVVRIPFRDNSVVPIREYPMQPSNIGFEASACKHCRNNPANGGNGICHCILGQYNIY